MLLALFPPLFCVCIYSFLAFCASNQLVFPCANREKGCKRGKGDADACFRQGKKRGVKGEKSRDDDDDEGEGEADARFPRSAAAAAAAADLIWGK